MTTACQDLHITVINWLAIHRTVHDLRQIAWRQVAADLAQHNAVEVGEQTAFRIHSRIPFDPRRSEPYTKKIKLEVADTSFVQLLISMTGSKSKMMTIPSYMFVSSTGALLTEKEKEISCKKIDLRYYDACTDSDSPT